MRKNGAGWRVLSLGFVFLLACICIRAQNSTGRILGSVTDPQGGVVAGATVTVTNVATSVSQQTTTGPDGSYQVLDLPIGPYTVTVESPGFAKAVTTPQQLEINQSLRVDVALRLGSVSETVSVEAQPTQVETINPTIGGTVTGAPIKDLPLNGRNTLDLALTQPGVVPSPSTGYGGGQFTVAGGRADAVAYLLDGGTNDSVTGNSVVFNPNPDTVAEFRILTNNYTAEYGRNGGGVVTVVTKSGTNQFHGSLFEYLRNDDFNANDFFNNEQEAPRPVLKRNQFGATIGGPITIPKIINGKDRLFFFFGYEGQRQTSTLLGSEVTTYTPSEISGNFSHSGPGGGPDPGVVAYLQQHPYFQPNPGLAAQGIIDPTRIDPVAQAYIRAGLLPVTSSGSLIPRAAALDNFDQYIGRADFYATANDRLSFTIGTQTEPQLNPFSANYGQPDVLGYASTNSVTNELANVAYTKTISANLLNEFHATAERYYNTLTPATTPPTPSALGIHINSDLETGPTIITFGDSGMNIGFNQNVPRRKADNTYAFTDNLSWERGHHTFKTGIWFSILQENSIYSYQTNGEFDFFGSQGIGSGNDRADFLFGIPDQYSQYPSASNNEHQKQYAGFFQDEWKVTPRLALTLGIRYEYTSPETDTRGFSFSIIPGLHSTRLINAPPGLVFPGDKGAPKGWYFPDYNNWAPRFGFAWDPLGDGKTSVRGGFGVFYDTMNGWMSDWNNGVLPWYPSSFFAFSPSEAPADGASTIMSFPYQTAGVPDPFPSRPPPQDLNFAAAGYLPYGYGDLFVNPHLRTPYIYQYNVSVQRQLAPGLMAEVGYVGSSSHGLLTWIDENPVIPGTTTRLLNAIEGLIPSNGFAPLITFDGLNNGNYNGLIASLTKRTGRVHSFGQMFFTLSYTWSHNLDNGSGFNQRNGAELVPFYDHHRFYSNADFDIRQRFVFSGGWQLPFAEMWSTGPRRLTEGWSLYPILTLQTGMPLDIFVNPSITPGVSDPGPSGAGDPQAVRPDQVTPSIPIYNPRDFRTITLQSNGQTVSGNFWFNPNDIQVNPCIGAGTCPLGFYGSFQRNSIFGPGRANLDLALEKATSIHENVKLTFRAEAFNIFNHTQFQNPATNRATSSKLGQITRAYPPRILQLALRFEF